MTIQETITYFISQYNSGKSIFDIPFFYYCGITDDLDRRASEHNVSHFIATVKCDSFETACAIEEGLHNAGFDTGKQLSNGTENSIYVYMSSLNLRTDLLNRHLRSITLHFRH